jgi:hypothetical protein
MLSALSAEGAEHLIRNSVAGLLLLASCASKHPAMPLAAPPPAGPEGKAAYSFVFDPANPALAAGDGPHRELVRVIIDDHGHVAHVADSPLGSSDGGPHASDFRKAVEDAVHAWQFTPGVLRRVEPGHDLDGDGKPDYAVTTSYDLIPVYYDVKFTFEIVRGQGVVRKE